MQLHSWRSQSHSGRACLRSLRHSSSIGTPLCPAAGAAAAGSSGRQACRVMPLGSVESVLEEPLSDSDSAPLTPLSSSEFDVAVPVFQQCRQAGFSENKRAFSEEHRIRGFEAGPDSRASLVTMVNLLQVRSACLVH